jgi:hypothetical protein
MLYLTLGSLSLVFIIGSIFSIKMLYDFIEAIPEIRDDVTGSAREYSFFNW